MMTKEDLYTMITPAESITSLMDQWENRINVDVTKSEDVDRLMKQVVKEAKVGKKFLIFHVIKYNHPELYEQQKKFFRCLLDKGYFLHSLPRAIESDIQKVRIDWKL